MSKIIKLQDRINKYLNDDTTLIQCPKALQLEFNELSKKSKIAMKRLVTEALTIGLDKIKSKYGL